MKTYRLINGVEIPAIGMGTYPMFGSTLKLAVSTACAAGCRLFDTADNYYNETDLGGALRDVYQSTDIKRENLFLVSKISDDLYKPGELGAGTNKGVYFWKSSPIMQTENAIKSVLREKLDSTLCALNTDYLDLWLMHWPYPDFFEELWIEMIRVYESGKVRAIGVCNCRQRHIEKLKAVSDILPMVNQFETSPLNTKVQLVEYCDTNKIKIIVYSPLQSLKLSKKDSDLFGFIDELCIKYNKNRSQVLLRFDIDRGMIPIPKSKSPERLISNFDVFDFSLDNEEIMKLLSFNLDLQYLPESKSCPGL